MLVIYFSKKKSIKVLLVLAMVLISIVYTQSLRYGSTSVFLNSKRQLPIYSVETEEKKIAISFDAAWGTEFTDDILNILNERGIKTTFFLVGFWVDTNPDKVKKIAEEGHEIGNHSTNHLNMSKLSADKIRMEIEDTQRKIEQIAGDRAVKLFRPPFGDYNDLLIKTCTDMGYYVIQWDVDSLDWKNYGVDHMFQQVTSKARNGSIILFHNNADYIVKALPSILDNLISKGYKIIPISELIYKDNYYMDHTGRQKKSLIEE